jgi:medium-chain acyl-[acyl-carrier-protein] hydrolase
MTGNPWFPTPACHPEGLLQLFCFPCAGRGATLYRTWKELLPSTVDVWPVEYPGHESRFREPSLRSLDQLVGDLVDAIAQKVAMPFAFYGHSLGAMIAFETARRLRQKHGIEPRHLFVSSVRAPHLPHDRRAVCDAPDRDFRRELQVYGGTRDEVLANEELMQLLTPGLRADFCMLETYAYQPAPPLQVPITAFGGLADSTVPWYRLQEWSAQTTGNFRLHLLPGGHFFLDTAQPTLLSLLRDEIDQPPSSVVDTVPPHNDQTHLWRISLRLHAEAATKLTEYLTPDEVQRASAFMQKDDRIRSIVTRAALRLILSAYVDQPPLSIQIGYDDYGKPFVLEPAQARQFCFNVSHSGDWALIAVSHKKSVGVDVECAREGREIDEIASLVFTPNERQHMGSLPDKNRLDAFYELWVRKEACLKCRGLGFSGGPEFIEVLPSFDHSSEVRKEVSPFLASLKPADGYVGAIAIDGGCSSLLCREFGSA